jgi:hypothetical protein
MSTTNQAQAHGTADPQTGADGEARDVPAARWYRVGDVRADRARRSAGEEAGGAGLRIKRLTSGAATETSTLSGRPP